MEEGFSEAAPPGVADPVEAALAGLPPPPAQPAPAPAAAAAAPVPATAACGSSGKASGRSDEERTQQPHSQQGLEPAAAAAAGAGPLDAAAALMEVASPLKATPTEADSGQAPPGSHFCQVPDCSSELQEDEARYYKVRARVLPSRRGTTLLRQAAWACTQPDPAVYLGWVGTWLLWSALAGPPHPGHC